MGNLRYMISDAANVVNVESHVLRYWEDELGLYVPRNELGHRYYTEDNIREFQKIKEWKEQGYQLKAIRMMIQEERLRRQQTGESRELMMQMGNQPEPMMPKVTNQPEPGIQQMTSPSEESCEQPKAVPSLTQPVVHREVLPESASNLKLEQFQVLMSRIVRNAFQENAQYLGKEVGQEVQDKVIKEMNYLMRVQDEAEEERFRRLDAVIRSYGKKRRIKTDKQTKTEKIAKKDKKLNPNLST